MCIIAFLAGKSIKNTHPCSSPLNQALKQYSRRLGSQRRRQCGEAESDRARLAALQRAQARIDTGDRRVERRRHVHAHLVAGHEDRAQEVVREVRMRSAVVAVVLHAGQQAGADELQVLDERIVARIAVVAEVALATFS